MLLLATLRCLKKIIQWPDIDPQRYEIENSICNLNGMDERKLAFYKAWVLYLMDIVLWFIFENWKSLFKFLNHQKMIEVANNSVAKKCIKIKRHFWSTFIPFGCLKFALFQMILFKIDHCFYEFDFNPDSAREILEISQK